MLKRFNGLVALGKPIDDKNMESIFKEVRAIVAQLDGRKSRLFKPDVVATELLQEKLTAIKSFMGWYLNLPKHHQGFRSAISMQEALEFTFGIMENPRSAKSSLMKILWRPDIPMHILEARCFDAYSNLNLKKLLFKPAEGDYRGESGDFPFSKDLLLKPDLFSRTEQAELAKMLLDGKIAELATRVMQRVEGIEGLIDRKELISRLQNLMKVAKWYFTLDPSIAPKPLALSKEEFARRIWFDNVDLLMRKDVPSETLRQTFRYVLIARGVAPELVDGLIDGPISEQLKIKLSLGSPEEPLEPKVIRSSAKSCHGAHR
jgi:hypothetical protein